MLGIEHILTGYDHLLFLLGLLVVCTRPRVVLTIVSCFTLAHSVTLALAGLGWVRLPSRVVEPLIAASIAYVGIENVVRGWRGRGKHARDGGDGSGADDPPGRWAVTAGFGLVHGFGFASALQATGLGQNGTSIVVPLLSFNLGVELGQLGVAAVALPLLWRLRTWSVFRRWGVMLVSAVVAVCGVVWVVARLHG